MISIEFVGSETSKLDFEAGVMRLQRIPPTERSGRVHSSSVTVAVFDSSPKLPALDRSNKAFVLEWFGGTCGAGGQRRNKVETSVRVTHVPTGIVKTAQTASRESSRRLAMTDIMKELDRVEAEGFHCDVNSQRQNQIGDGRRGNDRRRTFRFQDGQVTDTISGKTARTMDVMKGKIDLLWN